MANSDSGGIGAKKGFLYQDYVAALNVLFMLQNKKIQEVRCEVSDDIDIVYEEFIEYVQVKTTASNKSWLLTELTNCSKKTVPAKKPGSTKVIKNKDSILHKSLSCDTGKLLGHFRIVTPRDLHANLSYLKVALKDRTDKDKRNTILKSLSRALNGFASPKGTNAEYWLDHATWEVLPTIEQIKLLATSIITKVAFEHCAVHLNPTRDPERILNDLLVNIIEKSATSIVLKSVDSKTYKRADFLTWFEREIEHYNSDPTKLLKVYTLSGSDIGAILHTFFTNNSTYTFTGKKICEGVKGGYHRQRYLYEEISRGIKKWIPEVLLRPSEIADHAPERLEEKLRILTERKANYLSNIEGLVAKVLLHSLVRTGFKAQPIPAHLYIDDGKDTLFDNVHILINDHEPDALLMGFSQLINGDLHEALNKMVTDFDELLTSDAFTSRNEKLLESKEDGYLLKHDVDEILTSSTSLDENLSRFVFAFFIGYETHRVSCYEPREASSYLPELESEAISHFQLLIDSLIRQDVFFENLNIHVYIYPVPSMEQLLKAIQSESA